MKKLTHINKMGKLNMADVSEKPITTRECSAYGEVFLSAETYKQVKNNELKKGDIFNTAKIAGIQAGKRTSELIPLCHNIPISKIDIDIKSNDRNKSLEIISYAKTNSNTGIEMEALTAVSAAALTIYDMCKSIDHEIVISCIQLLEKSGGRSGTIKRSIKRK